MATKRKGREIGGIIAVIVIVIVVVGLFARRTTRHFEQTVVAQAQQHLLTLAKVAATGMEDAVTDTGEELKLLSAMPTVRERIKNGVRRTELPDSVHDPMAAAYARCRKLLGALYRLDANGIVQGRIPFKENSEGTDYSQRPGVKKILESHASSDGAKEVSGVYISEVFLPGTASQEAISICVPVLDEGRLIGVIRGLIFLEDVNDTVCSIKVGERGYAQIIDDQGIMIAHPDRDHVGENVIGKRKELLPDQDWSDMEAVLAEMSRGEEGVGAYYSAWWGEEKLQVDKKLTAFAPIHLGNKLWSMNVVMDSDEVSGPVSDHARGMAAAAGLLMFAVICGGFWYSKSQQARASLEMRAETAAKLSTLNTELVKEISERKRASQQLLEYQEQLHRLAAELSSAESRERRKLATDLHDQIGQTLALAKIKLGVLRQLTQHADPGSAVDEVSGLLTQALQGVRTLTFELSPPVLYDLGLMAALKWLAGDISSEHGIAVHFSQDTSWEPTSEELRSLLYRAVRELLLNVVRHAQAHHATVRARRDGNNIRIVVEDDGIGFEVPDAMPGSESLKGYGLLSLRERLGYIGGSVEIDSKPGRGTRVTLMAPAKPGNAT